MMSDALILAVPLVEGASSKSLVSLASVALAAAPASVAVPLLTCGTASADGPLCMLTSSEASAVMESASVVVEVPLTGGTCKPSVTAQAGPLLSSSATPPETESGAVAVVISSFEGSWESLGTVSAEGVRCTQSSSSASAAMESGAVVVVSLIDWISTSSTVSSGTTSRVVVLPSMEWPSSSLISILPIETFFIKDFRPLFKFDCRVSPASTELGLAGVSTSVPSKGPSLPAVSKTVTLLCVNLCTPFRSEDGNSSLTWVGVTGASTCRPSGSSFVRSVATNVSKAAYLSSKEVRLLGAELAAPPVMA
mmetsp:Transcript_52021/g.96318  ORF Transcript_52021/g.96318 Transcript_52021/m.96318 type:complete len:308 (-) Transcript_52021:368-1291(-)